jgi:hypothetical protein
MYTRIAYYGFATFFLLIAATGGCVAFRQGVVADSDNRCGEWSLIGRGTNLIGFFPNTYTEYRIWSYFRSTRAATTAFRITGQFPYARFTAFQSSGAGQGRALADFEIAPDPGSVNPFRPGTERYAANRSYAIWFVPPGSAREGEPNTIVIPENTDFPSLLLRIIKPDRGKTEHGGVPLPTIEAFDDKTGEPVSCPFKAPPVSMLDMPSIALPPAEDNISFYYMLGGDEFGRSRSGIPLFARLPPSREGKIAALRFKVPSFPDTVNNPHTVFKKDDEVRMALICAHGLWSTLTSECLADDEFKKDRHGFATVIVGPEDDKLKAEAQRRGYDYLSWGHFLVPALFYRQILPREDFQGSAWRVPVYDATRPLEPQGAEHFMGAYAPTGRLCSASAFLKGDACGLPH